MLDRLSGRHVFEGAIRRDRRSVLRLLTFGAGAPLLVAGCRGAPTGPSPTEPQFYWSINEEDQRSILAGNIRIGTTLVDYRAAQPYRAETTPSNYGFVIVQAGYYFMPAGWSARVMVVLPPEVVDGPPVIKRASFPRPRGMVEYTTAPWKASLPYDFEVIISEETTSPRGEVKATEARIALRFTRDF